MLEPLRIPERIYREIVAEAEAELPLECCGLLGGSGRLVGSRYPLRNRAPQPETSYFASPEDLFDSMRRMRKRGEDLCAIYHSHPRSSAYPSPKDVEMAFYPDAVYLIVSLDGGVEMRAYTIVEGLVTGLDLQLA